jgi:serine O-acetyltransferase
MSNFFALFKSDLKHKAQLIEEDGHAVSSIKLLLSDGVSAMFLYRLMRLFASNKLTYIFAILVHKLNILVNHCVIGINTDFGPGFAMMHPVGVVVNGAVKGGRGIALESGVVIGSVRGKSPCLHDNIYVGAGAKIIGDITVKSNTKIGANAVVVKSIEEGKTVVGIPAKPLGKSV